MRHSSWCWGAKAAWLLDGCSLGARGSVDALMRRPIRWSKCKYWRRLDPHPHAHAHAHPHPHPNQVEQMQLLEKEQLQLRKDQEVEHAQLRKGKEALVKGHLAETDSLRAELQEAAKQKDKALREQAERSAGELRI